MIIKFGRNEKMKETGEMKERFAKRKRRDIFIALCMSVMLLLGVVQAAFASESAQSAGKTGSLSLTLAVTENGVKTALGNVPLALYQVGTMETEPVVSFTLDPKLSGTGVDLNDLKTAADAEKACQVFERAVKSVGIEPLTVVTDANGNASFRGLAEGVYLIVQAGMTDFCKVSPMLLSVPYSSDGTTLEYDVEAFPKAEKVTDDKEQKGNLTVTKKLYVLDENFDFVEVSAADATYYVRLFLDENATIPYGDAKAIHIQGQSSGSVSYTDLPPGTYYVRETDAQGNPRPLDDSFVDETGVDVNCTITVNGDEMTSVTFDASAENFSQEAVVENLYIDLPDGFYMERVLWIQKNVVKGDEQTTTDDKFYATVNEVDPDTGDETTITTVELDQNDKVMVTFQVMDLSELEVTHTYRVFESDKDGAPVDKSTFGYVVSGEGNISFVGDENEKTITITNTVKDVTPTPSTSSGATPTSAPGSGSGSGSTSSGNVRTGDQTPIVMWIVILCVAAVAVGAVFVYRRGKKR